VPNSLDVDRVIPDHVEVERTLQGRMVGLLAKADPGLRRGREEVGHRARHEVSQARCRYFLLLRRGALFEKVKSTQINPVRLGDRVAFCVASRANDGARRIRHGGLETKGSGRRTGPPAGRRRAPLASSAARRGRTSAWW